MMDIELHGPIEPNFLRIGEFGGVKAGCDKVCEDRISFPYFLCGSPVLNGGIVRRCAQDSEGRG
jgi:hypothetical protein